MQLEGFCAYLFQCGMHRVSISSANELKGNVHVLARSLLAVLGKHLLPLCEHFRHAKGQTNGNKETVRFWLGGRHLQSPPDPAYFSVIFSPLSFPRYDRGTAAGDEVFMRVAKHAEPRK